MTKYKKLGIFWVVLYQATNRGPWEMLPLRFLKKESARCVATFISQAWDDGYDAKTMNIKI